MRVQFQGISKRYGELRANDDVNLDLAAGKVHALLGENGAGKSTLMSILYGMTTADEGSVLLDEKAVELLAPADAMAAGVGMVHQHFLLIPTFTVAQNVLLGIEPVKRWLRSDVKSMKARVAELGERFGLEIDPGALVNTLSIGSQQRVEILKALARDARVLILDEPTAVLSSEEAQKLFTVMRSLAADGRTIIFVTHRLNEVRQVADTVTVMRRGRIAGECAPDVDRARIVELMLGEARDVESPFAPSQTVGDVVLDIEDLNVQAPVGSGLRGLTLQLRAGEVLGVAGVDGNGQSELVQCLIGTGRADSGTIRLAGRAIDDDPPSARFSQGLGCIAEDRHRDGMVAGLNVAENLLLTRQHLGRFRRRGLLSAKKVRSDAESRISEFDIRVTSSEQLMGRLSGGNQQKVVIARELARDLSVLVAAQPTRGVDFGAASYIHSRIVDLRDSGVGVLLVSAELDEVLAISDRLVVIAGGRIVLETTRPWSREAIGAAMSHDTEGSESN